MTLRRQLLATVVAAALLSITSFSGLGQDSLQTTFSVSILGGGPMTASLSSTPLSDFGNQGSIEGDRAATGTLFLSMLDMRGLASGWTVLLAANDFMSPAGHIGADALTLSPGAISVQQGNPDLSGHSVFETAQMSTASIPLWSAETHVGDGQYTLALNGSLTLPETHTIGVYTVIVTIRGTAP